MDTTPTHPSALEEGVIEVNLREVAQLFNSFDPSPFPAKDLNANAEKFIVSWALEFPQRLPLTMRIHLATPPADPAAAGKIENSIHSFFAHESRQSRLKLRQLLARGRLSLLIGVLFLAACVTAADLVENLSSARVFQILRESLLIGGWVAMWRPMEIFLYDWWPLRRERRVFDRLSNAKVEILVK